MLPHDGFLPPAIPAPRVRLPGFPEDVDRFMLSPMRSREDAVPLTPDEPRRTDCLYGEEESRLLVGVPGDVLIASDCLGGDPIGPKSFFGGEDGELSTESDLDCFPFTAGAVGNLSGSRALKDVKSVSFKAGAGAEGEMDALRDLSDRVVGGRAVRKYLSIYRYFLRRGNRP
jgi:hypothetical protein